MAKYLFPMLLIIGRILLPVLWIMEIHNELMIWEKIFIYKHAHHIMNFEIPPESSLIKKYVCRSPDSASIAPTSKTTMRDVTLQSI